MSEQVPIRPSEEIQFGRAMVVDELETVYGYLLYSFNSTQPIVSESSTHPLVKYLKMVRAIMADIRLENFTITGSTTTEAICCLNLGRLARLRHENESYIHTLKQISTELRRNLSGVASTDTNTVAPQFIPIAKWCTGAMLEGFVGSWNTTHYRPADDILAGAVIVLCYALWWWTGFLKSYHKLFRKIGTFSIVDGVTRGNYRPFDPRNPATWGSLLLSVENKAVNQWGNVANTHTYTWKSTGVNIFGLSQDMVDDPKFRAIPVTIYTHADAFWNTFLTRTEWQWRHAKSVSWEPVFSLQRLGSAEFEGCNGDTEDVENFADMQLFSGATTGGMENNWSWFNQYVNDTVSAFKEFYFKNPSYGKIKSLFSTMPFTAVPLPPDAGIGGLLAYNEMTWSDGGADHADYCYPTHYIDTTTDGFRVLKSRRDTVHNNKFLLIGDITPELMKQFLVLSGCNEVFEYGDSELTELHASPLLVPNSGFFFAVTKEEEVPYMCDRKIHWMYADATKDNQCEYVNGSSSTHPGKSRILPRTWVVSGTYATQYQVGASIPKSYHYEGRSADPYKKLKHMVYDMNMLDVEFLRKTALSLFWPVGGTATSSLGTLAGVGPVVSAMPSSVRPDGELVERPTDPLASNMTPVSAVPLKKEEVKK